MTEQPVVTARDGAILIVTLNRPDRLNSITKAMAEGIAAAMDELDNDDTLAVGILTGAGGRFSAGADVKGFLVDGVPRAGGRGFAGIVEKPSRKPLIAAIEGLAIGGGFEMALACDLIVAAAGAKIGLPETKVGLAAAGGGLLNLSRAPVQLAMELNLIGDPLPAERLHAVGIVNRIAEPGEALTVALDLARRIAANAPVALAGAKEVIRNSATWSTDERWKRQAEITDQITNSDDAKEGFQAFIDKRKPVWSGR
ncbi:enoyl-CoA hydratase [Tardibacter chloracetimidivorans]|uniref:Enoyl-CoA hydratase n=1 Tax=Tardibacter chloracetimidivorans TaxID=1921510 RepID=A0A1L3ZSM6_9SPHN|nr:crotonase/enoyl-CoA hydratase family protein [Tardibacter chloracetimidivorans]API58646.1 enoyl-CoA hydratase [Tardibacter chloracetimidivorans]